MYYIYLNKVVIKQKLRSSFLTYCDDYLSETAH